MIRYKDAISLVDNVPIVPNKKSSFPDRKELSYIYPPRELIPQVVLEQFASRY